MDNFSKSHNPVENQRFTTSDDSGAWGVFRSPTRREKAADRPLRAGKGEISFLVGLD